MAEVNFDYFLRRKYAQLQQQADATTKNAATSALTGRAAANFDNVRASLLPTESRANVAQTQANTNLIDQQAAVVAPESQARIRQMDAGAQYTGTQDAVLRREGLMTRSTSPSALSSVLGARGYTGFQLGDIVPARRSGETEASYLYRINGF